MQLALILLQLLISQWYTQALCVSEITDPHFAFCYEIEDVEKEIFQTETKIKALTEEASKRENYYKNYNEDFANKIKYLEVGFIVLFINLEKISDGYIGSVCCSSLQLCFLELCSNVTHLSVIVLKKLLYISGWCFGFFNGQKHLSPSD